MKAKFLNLVIVLLMTAGYAVAQQSNLQYYIPLGQDRVGKFETNKTDTVEFEGVKVRIGGAFAQQLQMLSHTNSHTEAVDNDGAVQINSLYLMNLKKGFNNAVANFNIDAQLADGVRLELVTYLSSLHHTEAWVKGGFIQFDKLPFINNAAVESFMDIATIKIGHMEINYGDGHFRRTDNGNAITNPFVGNYIMDAFNTEIGAEIYVQTNGLILMGAVTEGEIKGSTAGTNTNSGAAYMFKAGYDNQMNEDLRLRLTGSLYTTYDRANGNNLYSGDRTGTRYQNVIQDIAGSPDFRAARWNPNFRNKVTSIMINPYVEFNGLEFFGMYETSSGYRYDNNLAEDAQITRTANQLAGELIYRFGANNNFYVGTRFNKVYGELEGSDPSDIPSITRKQFAAGWFLSKNILAKLEYVDQKYSDFADPLYDGARFNGIVFEAVIGF